MKKLLLLTTVVFYTITHASAQIGKSDDIKKELEVSNKDTVAWVYGGVLSIGANGGLLHNWSAGGELASLLPVPPRTPGYRGLPKIPNYGDRPCLPCLYLYSTSAGDKGIYRTKTKEGVHKPDVSLAVGQRVTHSTAEPCRPAVLSSCSISHRWPVNHTFDYRSAISRLCSIGLC